MKMWLVLETDIPAGLEQAYKESIAMDAEEWLGQNVRVVAVETAEEDYERVKQIGMWEKPR